MSVNRCYSEKKPGFDVEARSLFASLHDLLEISSLTHVRYLCRYDTEGLAPAAYEKAKGIVFSEPMADVCYDEDFPRPAGAHTVLAVEPLPGQFDQRADSCAQCIQLLTGGERPAVAAAKIYVLEGDLSAADMDKIRGYLINPVEAREASMDKPATLKVEYAIPTTVASVTGFIHMDEAALSDLLTNMGLAMDLDDLKFLQSYFRDEEKRDPTITEVRMVDTYWSDHCRHTTFLTEIDGVEIHDPMVQDAFDRYLAARVEVYGEEKAAKRPVTLMDIATAGAKVLKKRGYLKNIDESRRSTPARSRLRRWSAATMKTGCSCSKRNPQPPDRDRAVRRRGDLPGRRNPRPAFRPQLCLPGLRVTGAGDPTVPLSETLEHKLPQRKLCQTAAAGYSSYGNQIVWRPGWCMRSITRVMWPSAWRSARSWARPRSKTSSAKCGAGRHRHPARRPHRPRRLRRRDRLVPKSTPRLRSRPAAQRYRRATRPRSARFSACSARQCHPHDPPLQRLRRGRRIGCHRRAGRRPGHRPERRAQEVRRSGRHRACHLGSPRSAWRSSCVRRTRTRSSLRRRRKTSRRSRWRS